ncbi:hypothetical protein GCM10017774_72580 [Lentzea cavernae]|uniref:Leucine rich repeat variant n=1 Tax=Lentzea cavernae TaxID=2020703 RepID=A0ABQ3MVT8_9PSEU|nr:hypothetical protein GCM10017774_72580 [Lentzea cavernae]
MLDRLAAIPSLAPLLAERADLSASHVRTLLSHGNPSAVHTLLEKGLVHPADVPVANESVALVLTGHPATDSSLTRALAFHPDPTVRRRLPEHAHSLPADVIDRLACDTPEVAAELAASHALPPAVTWALSRHPSIDVRRAVAASSFTSAPVLVALSSEDDLARELASNPATPPPVAADLVRHHASRYFLASRTDLPVPVYEELASEFEPGILTRLASNPAVPAHVLRQLTDTRALRHVLLRNPAVPLDLLVELAPVARIGSDPVPRIASASAAELRELAASPVAQVRMMVAARPDLPLDVVAGLVGDPDDGVVAAVVTSPSVSVAQLWELVSRPGVFPRVALNPLCPAELLQHMALRGSSVGETCRAIARHPNASGETLLLCLGDAQARYLAAGHPHLPVDEIVRMLGSEFTARAAASNPSLPVRVMERLVPVSPTT